jgi:hypothetical protein
MQLSTGPLMFRPYQYSLAFTIYFTLILVGCGGSGTSTPPTQISISISPLSATVTTGNTQQFTANVSGTTNTAVTWSVLGGVSNGTISTTGLYLAPATVPSTTQKTVTATSQADSSKSASAAVTVQSAVGVQILPQAVTLQVLGMQQFNANVTGSANQAVTWGVAGGNANGTITSSGFYTAPATVPNPSQVTVNATSQAAPTKVGTATVTVIAATPSVSVMPNPENVAVFSTQQFIASTNNLSSSAVNWQVNGIAGGSQQFGFISSSGLYVAPGGVPTMSSGKGDVQTTTVTVTAASQINPTVSGSAIVTVFPLNQNPQGNPIILGTSGGNQNDSQTSGNQIFCCSGTLGSVVIRGGNLYVLSNNHVLARSDLGTVTSGTTPGDNMVQPGLIDSNCGQGTFDVIANLSQFYNLETGASPKIDAAIAESVPNGVDPTGKILFLGDTTDQNNVPIPGAPHAGSGLPESSGLISRSVAKSGRSTGLTCSTILSISTIVSVQYQKGCSTGTTFQEVFTNQIDVAGGSFSAPGDSGSLIVTQDTADPIALLFAGSDQDAVGNPVTDVLNFFQSGSNTLTFVGAGTHAVIGCTLPTAPASTVLSVPLSAVSDKAVEAAITVLDANASELLAHPEFQAVGIGASFDHPAEPAILLFIPKGQQYMGIPATVSGIRTRIIEEELVEERGLLSASQSAAMQQSAPMPQIVYPISELEFARAKVVYNAHAEEWMNKAGVQGVGIGSSVDSPGEATFVIFLIRGVAHEVIPPVIDGLRTRVRESSRFRAGLSNEQHRGYCYRTESIPVVAKPAFSYEGLYPKDSDQNLRSHVQPLMRFSALLTTD